MSSQNKNLFAACPVSCTALLAGSSAGALALLAACSMAGSIQRNALEYNASVAGYNDQMLLYTILRARDEAPINLLALSTINGSVSIQAGVGGTSTYQHFKGAPSSPEINYAQTVVPSVAATSAPTWSMASLDTQGFMLGIIQPVSPMYVVSKWSSGIDREFLLRLFIKTIEIKDVHGYHEYLNDPGSAVRSAQFSQQLHSWFPLVGMRALTVLEPLGPPFDPASVTTVSTTWDDLTNKPAARTERTDALNATNASLVGAYQHLMPLGTGPYHIGNAAPGPSGSLRLQLYREYPQQVVVCVPRATLRPHAGNGSGGEAPLGPSEELEHEEEEAMSAYALALKSAAKNGAGHIAPGPSASGPGAVTISGTPQAPKPASASSLASNLKVDRVAAVLPFGACGRDELVLPPYTEEQNARDAGNYSHVEWRSIDEVIDYLGALLRPQSRAAASWESTDADGRTVRHILFQLTQNGPAGFAQVPYRGATYAVQSDADRAAADSRDHSMQALALLNELIGTAKVSSDIPNTQAIQIVP